MSVQAEWRLAPKEVKAQRAVRAAFVGFFVDMFDVYLPISALAPALSYFAPADLSSVAQATIFSIIFAVTLIGRPVGAVIFGHYGDTIGRRRTTLISVAGFTVVTFLITVLPGYQSIGLAAVVLLILLRFLDGVFIGGEYTAANPLAMEYAPRARRGLYGALIHVGYPGALLVTAGLTAIMLGIAPGGGPTSAYAQWGWRVPFAIGVLFSAGLFLYYWRRVPESEIWQAAKKTGSPLRELVRGSNLRRVGQLFIVMTGAWLTLNATIGALPGLGKVLGADGNAINAGTLIAAGIAVVVFPFLGLLSQRWGRRPTIAFIGLLNTVPAGLLYFLLVVGGYQSAGTLIALVAALSLLSLLIWAVHTPYIAESFHTGVRAAGYGISYSLATIIPGLYSLYQLGLSAFMPYAYTAIVLLVLGGVLLTAGALAGPETRDVDFEPVEKPEDAEAAERELQPAGTDRLLGTVS